MPQCPSCLQEVGPDFRFCPNCGFALTPVAVPPQEQPKRSSYTVAAVVLVIVLLVLVSIFVVIPTTSPSRTSATIVNCPPTPAAATAVSAPTPDYDVQQVMLYAQSYAQLSVNVTATAQCDTNGYGPSYLLNGLTNTGYWYQVGVDWNWPIQSGGYISGFGFVSEAWAPGGYTRSSPFVPFSGPVNDGDTVELSLSFSNGQVAASAVDLETGANGSATFPDHSATQFIGTQAQQSDIRFSFATQGYFTGLMTEWYHVSPNYGGAQEQVTYTGTTAISSATFAVGEWNFTGGSQNSVFSDVANNGLPVILTNQPQQFTLNGYTVSATENEFVTGA